MKIDHNGQEWHGTFGIVLTAMVTDLLSDGEPIDLLLRYEDRHGHIHSARVTVTEIDPTKGVVKTTTPALATMELDSILTAQVMP